MLLGVLIIVGLVALVGPWASSDPDGLERVSSAQGFDDTADDHALAEGPLADYEVGGVDDDRTSTGLAGAVGVALTLLVVTGGLALVRRTGSGRRPAGSDGVDPARSG